MVFVDRRKRSVLAEVSRESCQGPIPKHRSPCDTNHEHMRYLGEYLIPIAAIILVLVVALRDEIRFGERLVKRFIERMREGR